MEAVAQWHAAPSHKVGNIGDPGHHHAGGVGVAEALLNAQAVKRIGIIARPHLLNPRQYAQINAATSSGTRFKVYIRMAAAQFVDDPVEIAHVIEPDAPGVLVGLLRPARLAKRTVDIPLDELDVMPRKQAVKRCEHPV